MAPFVPASGRLTVAQLGLVINVNDPYSVAVGQYYIQHRGLHERQVLRVSLPVRPALSPEELNTLRQQIADHFSPRVQALALAWRQPWAVGCNSITSAVSLGYQAAQCQNTCRPGLVSPYFNDATTMPFSTLGMRPSMLLAASTVERARALVDRGVQADGAMLRPGPMARAVFAASGDALRDVRVGLFPPSGQVPAARLEIRRELPEAFRRPRPEREAVLIYQTGAVRVPDLASFHFVPGAVADHLTSFGGVLEGNTGQMPITAWVDAGATASHGTVSEPCNHTQKFPHPQLLLLRMLEGATLLEVYWKSLAWPTQSLLVGEPLAAPYAQDVARNRVSASRAASTGASGR